VSARKSEDKIKRNWLRSPHKKANNKLFALSKNAVAKSNEKAEEEESRIVNKKMKKSPEKKEKDAGGGNSPETRHNSRESHRWRQRISQ